MKFMLREVIFSILLSFFLSGCASVKNPWLYWSDSNSKSIEEENKERLSRREKRHKYIAEHPELSERTKGLILSGIVEIGFNKEQLEITIGCKPNEIKISNLKYNADEMWFYRSKANELGIIGWFYRGGLDGYYYFKDDMLIRIDDKR